MMCSICLQLSGTFDELPERVAARFGSISDTISVHYIKIRNSYPFWNGSPKRGASQFLFGAVAVNGIIHFRVQRGQHASHRLFG